LLLASERRSRRAGIALPGLILAVAVVLAGCSSTHRARASNVPLIAWDGAVPAPLQQHPVEPASPCRAAQLRVVGPGFQFAPALSGGTGSITVRNAGPAPCRLSGRPDVALVGARPAPQQRRLTLPAEPPEFPRLAPPDTVLQALPVGATATLAVDWRNWCVPASGSRTAPVPPRAVRLTLPGSSHHLDVDYNAVPACDAPEQPSTLSVRPWQPSPLPATAPWTSTAVLAKIVSLDGKRSITGRRGEVVRYAVELRNPESVAVSFGLCPLVVEMVAPTGRPEGHQLNCRGTGQLTPKASVRFEMRVQIPADAPVGANGLFWELDPTGAQGPEAVSRVIVTK
jgi:hypothetical protein